MTRASLEAALASARATVASLEAALAAMDEQGETLVTLRDGAMGIPGDTLVRWCREGRLQAYEAERGRLCAWMSDIRRAIEAKPYRRLRAVDDEVDPLDREIADGRLAATR